MNFEIQLKEKQNDIRISKLDETDDKIFSVGLTQQKSLQID